MTITGKKAPKPPESLVKAFSLIHRGGRATDQESISAAAEIQRCLTASSPEGRFAIGEALMDGILSPSGSVNARTALVLGVIINNPEFPAMAPAERGRYLRMAHISAASLREDPQPKHKRAAMRLAKSIPLR